MKLIFSDPARKHLSRLKSYLADRFYPENAVRFVERIVESCDSLCLAPYRGTKRDDLRPGVRSIGFEGVVSIYFEVYEDSVVILCVTYRGRIPRKADLRYKKPR